MRRFVLLAAVVACVLAPAAHADGLPVLGVDVGSSGVTVHGDADRYVTVTQSGATLVERIQRNGGRVLGLNRIPGNFTIPAVAYDGSASGLSADGQTLVLIEPRVARSRGNRRGSRSSTHARFAWNTKSCCAATSASTPSHRVERRCSSSTMCRQAIRRATAFARTTCARARWCPATFEIPPSATRQCAAHRSRDS